MKSASHELSGFVVVLILLGLMQIEGAAVAGLSLPLMCYIDFRGFRLIAVPLLPINSETLIYGSADAGKTVHADIEEVNSKMEKLGRILNLKVELC